ncbi:uncharacterized protein LOC114289504 [Camellia sinensis]|uniref:uncharacterized protein LOC114289504 n=1 Tax=Camellia sinensis TaxID=4442 RepID=UPI00103574C1|nr:uncharacterized protein LOC114289504 [Camellia sinensis]
MSKYDEGDKVNPTYFKSLVQSLRYLTATLPDILFAVGLVSRYMEKPKMPHLKATKRILRYVKGIIEYELFYSSTKKSKLVGYRDSDWAGNVDDRKSTAGLVFCLRDTAFTWPLKKQPIVTLSTCEVEYVAIVAGECHAIRLRNLLKEVQEPQQEATEIYVDNTSAI